MRTRPPPSSLRINLFELRNFPLNIDTELQVLKLLDSPTFQLPITECLTASELLPINPPPTQWNPLPSPACSFTFPLVKTIFQDADQCARIVLPPLFLSFLLDDWSIDSWNRLLRLNVWDSTVCEEDDDAYPIPIFFLLFLFPSHFRAGWKKSRAN